MPSSAIADRFWTKVNKTEEGCWNWTAAKFRNGYGMLGRKDGGTKIAHRISYELNIGQIPAGFVIDHVCHNRACVRPSHLRAVTQKQNVENTGMKKTNTSGFVGVTWNVQRSKWRAEVRHNRRSVHVGYFDNPEDANTAALAKRNELFTHNDLDRVA